MSYLKALAIILNSLFVFLEAFLQRWASICRFIQVRYLLRALGFELLNALLRKWSGRETRKPVLRRSRWIALSRCAIHILPVLVFLFLVPLNFSAMYLGPGFSYRNSNGVYLVLFQIGAKLLEIVCVASLTTVVLHVLRHDLLRDGVPLGFVGSGMFFSQASFFWSPETFAATLYSVKSWKKLRLLLLVTVAGALALLIAPSSAVLLQPRIQDVPAGGTAYYLPVAPNQLWPSELNSSDELHECLGDYRMQNIVCASAGFESLRNFFSNINTSFNVIDSMMWDTYHMQPLVVQGMASKIPRLMSRAGVIHLDRETSMTQANAITAVFQNALTQDWQHGARNWSGSPFSAKGEFKYADQRLSSVVTLNPMVLPACSIAQNVSTGPSQIMFPVKAWKNREGHGSSQWEEDWKPFNVTIVNDTMSSYFYHEWVDLPTDQFGPVSGGILLHMPRTQPDSTRAVIGCSISASWFSGEITSDSLNNQGAWALSESSKQWATIRIDLDVSSPDASKSRRLVTIRKDWFQSLTPLTPCIKPTNKSQKLTTLGCIFSDVGLLTIFHDLRTQDQPRYVNGSCIKKPPDPSETDVDRWNRVDCGNGAKHQLLEIILGAVFVNGLSRYGSRHAFDPTSMELWDQNPFKWELKSLLKAPDYYTSLLSGGSRQHAVLPAPAGSDTVKLHMHIAVTGYAWYARSFSDYFALAVVIIYMMIALAHMAWVLMTGVTSSSWDSVTELLALALGSPVPGALEGSGAGIERLGTYRRMVRLRARKEEEDERLVLLVDGDEDVVKGRTESTGNLGAQFDTVAVDAAYT